MDDFEKTLTEVIDHFVALQLWSTKPEGSRKPTSVFPTILAVDRGLKKLKHADKAHQLQELAHEIRTAFNTREFRAMLLAAFNWRSAQNRGSKPIKQKQPPVLLQKRHPHHKSHSTPTSRKPTKPTAPKPTAEQIKREAENTKKFMRNFMAFVNSIPPETLRRLREPEKPEKHVDIYNAGRRLHGSYGAGR